MHAFMHAEPFSYATTNHLDLCGLPHRRFSTSLRRCLKNVILSLVFHSSLYSDYLLTLSLDPTSPTMRLKTCVTASRSINESQVLETKASDKLIDGLPKAPMQWQCLYIRIITYEDTSTRLILPLTASRLSFCFSSENRWLNFRRMPAAVRYQSCGLRKSSCYVQTELIPDVRQVLDEARQVDSWREMSRLSHHYCRVVSHTLPSSASLKRPPHRSNTGMKDLRCRLGPGSNSYLA